MADSHPPLAPNPATDLAPQPAPAHPAPAVRPDPGPEPDPPTDLALPPSPTPWIDAHGFDPANYRWVPVRRKPRKDGWSEAKQRLFIEVLADTGCVEDAANAVRMSVQSAYALRRAPGGEAFAAAWSAAQQQGALRLADVAFERALKGTDEPVFDRTGAVIGSKTRYSERLLVFLLRAHLPERYAHAHRAERPDGAPPPPHMPALAEAIARLEPAPPAAPHTLMPPDALDDVVASADILDGKLPGYCQPVPPDQPLMPYGEDFERRLEAARLGFDHDEALDPETPQPGKRGRSRPKLS